MAKRRNRRKKLRTRTEQDRLEGDLPRPEYVWMNSVNGTGGPNNPAGIPAGLHGISANPDETIAWVSKNCKFAKDIKND
jgi:hypothetical protein